MSGHFFSSASPAPGAHGRSVFPPTLETQRTRGRRGFDICGMTMPDSGDFQGNACGRMGDSESTGPWWVPIPDSHRAENHRWCEGSAGGSQGLMVPWGAAPGNSCPCMHPRAVRSPLAHGCGEAGHPEGPATGPEGATGGAPDLQTLFPSGSGYSQNRKRSGCPAIRKQNRPGTITMHRAV